MPGRRALTEAQLERLLALPTAEVDLARHWTLDGDDLAAVNTRRRAHNRLGFALQLCALRYPGRLLRPGAVIPERALRFVADQLGRASPRRSSATPSGSRPVTHSSMPCARGSASPIWRPRGGGRWHGSFRWRWPPRTPSRWPRR